LKVHPQTYVFAETRYARLAWEEFLGVPVSYVVHPVEVVKPKEENADKQISEILKRRDADCSALDASAPAKRVVFGFYGFARHEQGVDVLMRALEILKEKEELNAEFRIVWPKAFQMPDGSWMDREMFGHLGANVRFYENPLSPEGYLRELAETDWLVLPYRVASYEGRCSRISIEACVMGIPVIYTKGTDLEEVVRSHGEGIGAPEEDANKLADAILMAIRKNPAFKKKAVFKQAYAQADFSGNIFLGAIKK
jgi:glycosyltransferase involved in cell wall biosynthesis